MDAAETSAARAGRRAQEQLAALAERDQNFLWSEEPFGNEVRELQGVRARVIALPLLRTGKSSPRDDPDDAAKDRADFHALSRIAP